MAPETPAPIPFQTLVEHAAEGFELIGADGRILYVNPALCRMGGFEPHELVGGSGFQFIHPDDLPAVLESFQQVVSGASEPRLMRVRGRTRDGEWRWYESSGTNLLHDPAVRAILVQIRDVTREHEAEERLRRAHKMEAIGRLAGGIAHDFNNLLTIINGYSDLLLGAAAAESPSRDMVREIRRAGERAAVLTRQLLAFSQKQILRPAILDLSLILADLEKMLSRLIGEDIELILNVQDDAPLRVRADPAQLEQVILNLVMNARDAMPTGGRLTLEARTVSLDANAVRGKSDAQPGPYVVLEISDTGQGMDEETRRHVFEPFFTTKAVGKGTGMGLATVHGVVLQSQGFVEVNSAPGRGTTFSIYLPKIEEPQTKSLSEEQRSPRGNETVLLAEDETQVRALARIVLESNGYTVIEARDGIEALEIAKRHAGSIDLLLTDVVMPKMNGPQLAAEMSAVRPGLRVMYFSGYTGDAIIRNGGPGGTVFLQKPFTPGVLCRMVREVLDAPTSGDRS